MSSGMMPTYEELQNRNERLKAILQEVEKKIRDERKAKLEIKLVDAVMREDDK